MKKKPPKTHVTLRNMGNTPLWVPADIKAPDPLAASGSMEATWGLLAPGEAVEVPEAIAVAFVKLAGERVRLG